MVILNGEARELPVGATVRTLIQDLSLGDRPLAVEVNRTLVPKLRFAEVSLQEGDRVEIVQFVGGG